VTVRAVRFGYSTKRSATAVASDADAVEQAEQVERVSGEGFLVAHQLAGRRACGVVTHVGLEAWASA
jgi:hypothetical protein